MEQENLLTEIASILDRLNIPYVVTGSFALAIWGRPRFTADIDLIIQLTAEKLDRLAQDLLAVGKDAYLDKESMREALEKHGEFNFIHPASGLKVDFWVLANEPYSRQQLKRGLGQKINGQEVKFISPEDLILSKLAWYKNSRSERQLEDIKSIFKNQRKLNFRYINKWSSVQQTSDIFGSLKKEIKK